jgi:copper(I)-binding protein
MNNIKVVPQKRVTKFMAIAAAMVLSAGILTVANAQTAGDVTVSDAWIRASAPKQMNGAGYATIQNKSAQADRLISATADVAMRVELHTVITEKGVAQMRQVTGIDVPANGTASLQPGGFHVMFVKLNQPFEQGKTVPIKFTFERAGEVIVNFEVKPITYNPKGGSTGHGGHSMPGMKH